MPPEQNERWGERKETDNMIKLVFKEKVKTGVSLKNLVDPS